MDLLTWNSNPDLCSSKHQTHSCLLLLVFVEQYWWQALSVDSCCMRCNVLRAWWSWRENRHFLVVKCKRACEQTRTGFPNDYRDWCRLPGLIIPSHITLKPPAEKGSCSSFPMCLVCTYPPERVLGFACQPRSANPDWRLVIFSSCGVGLWYIKAHWGLALSASLAVWFDAAALSLGDPPGRVSYTAAPPTSPPSPSRPGTVWDRCLELSATQRGSSHGGQEKPCTGFYHSALRGPFFIPNALDFLFLLRLWKVCLFQFVSFSSVFPFPLCFPLWLRRWGHSVQRWAGFRVQRSPPGFLSTPTRRPFHSLTSCSLYGHFLHSLWHTHRSNLPIGTVKR